MRFYITIVTMAVLLVSCEEELDWQTESQTNDLLVVEAVLTNERMSHLVKLSHPTRESNGGWNPATGAIVAVSDGEDVHLLFEFPAGSGLYYTSSNFRALFGKQYFLFIQYDGKTYSATDSSVPGEPFSQDDVYSQINDSLYTLNFIESIGPSMTRHFLQWSHTGYCQETSSDSDCFAKVVHYDLKTVDLNESFRPPKEEVQFPGQTIIIRKRYSLSEPFRQFLRSMLSETEWRGGYFDVQRANVFTNLSEGAVGFFAVSTVVTDTLIVQ